MKLCEFKAVDPDRIEFAVVNRDGQRMRDPMVFSVPDDAGSVRVEIHSLNPEPWPTERPEGWGPGCWCEFHDHGVPRKAIALKTFSDKSGEVCKAITEDGNWWTVPIKGITAFGPRAEVPG